ncbi:MAG: AAA family ATPase [Chitinophagaceae bacterium]|nr:AAA family ATPase [Chitinophagaceae bacterium]
MASPQSELIAVIGRRRVGKTFLIKSVYEKQLRFYQTGMKDAPREEQLKNFSEKLAEYAKSNISLKIPETWSEALDQLKKYLQANKGKTKQVVFFDEVPWLATHKSGFLEALDYFWNDWASTANVVIVICGSAASWMLEHIVNNKGGLHNRITRLIRLHPFTLTETKTYLTSRGIQLDNYQLSQLYMAMGGIPHYLQAIKPGESAIQNINRICFEKDGMLRNEFQNLYAALFDHAHNHIAIVRALSQKWKGLTRKEIIDATKFTNGGGLTKVLTELEESSFINTILPFGRKKRETLYRLSDEYTLFYFAFIENTTSTKDGTWLSLTKSPTYQVWAGYAFENLCIKHIEKIKLALGISGIFTNECGFALKGKNAESDIQIDLLIDRDDRTINMCEMKYYNAEFELSKAYAQNLRIKRERFKSVTDTKKNLFITLITTYGLIPNEHSLGLVEKVVTLEDMI